MKKIAILGSRMEIGMIMAQIPKHLDVEIVSPDQMAEMFKESHTRKPIEFAAPIEFEMPFMPPMSRRERRKNARRK